MSRGSLVLAAVAVLTASAALRADPPGLKTLAIGAPDGKVLYRKSGAIEPLEVRRTIVDFLGRTYASRGK
jgi:hypothetical protein